MKSVRGFVQFVREQGIVGLAIGFILGGAISKLVASLVSDIIQPAVGMIFGSTNGLTDLHFGSIMYGNFLAVLIDFIIISAVVYYGFKGLRLDKLDIKKDGGTPVKISVPKP
ncbi:MAG: MscL family protein [Candidatus Gracilibacteria bacterium]